MKKISLLSLLFISAFSLMLVTSCTKRDVTFTLDIPAYSYSFAGQPTIAQINTFSRKQVLTDIVNKIKDNGGDPNSLKAVKLKSMTVSITSGQNFDAIDYAEGYISSPTVAEVKFAYKAPIPKTGLTSITMDNQFNDLSSYFKDDSVTIKVQGYNSAVVAPMTFSASASFDVTVGPK